MWEQGRAANLHYHKSREASTVDVAKENYPFLLCFAKEKIILFGG
jgi:hypothetical protein